MKLYKIVSRTQTYEYNKNTKGMQKNQGIIIAKQSQGSENLSPPQRHCEHKVQKIEFCLKKAPMPQKKKCQIFVKQGPFCSICLGDLDKKSKDSAFLECLHWYHHKCIEDWFKKTKICPICQHKTEDIYRIGGGQN